MNIKVKEQLLKEIEKTSDSTLKEVLDFLLFIKCRELQQELIKSAAAAVILRFICFINFSEKNDGFVPLSDN